MDEDKRVGLSSGDNPIEFKIIYGQYDRIKFCEEIGRGGSGICYRAIMSSSKTQNEQCCIIKEYYPVEKNVHNKKICYHREKIGEALKIIPKEDMEEKTFKDFRKNEIEIIQSIKDRELDNNKKIYFDSERDLNNAPFAFRMEELNFCETDRIDTDTFYMIVDTSDGVTLLEKMERHTDGILRDFSYLERCIGYVKRLLDVIEYINNKGFIHGDIALDNVFLAGGALDVEIENIQIKLLDFGSAFCPEEYRPEDFDDEEEIKDIAKKIIGDVTIGSSHNYICSPQIKNFNDTKDAYDNVNGYRTATGLVEALLDVNFKSDVYSVIILFYYMLFKKVFSVDGKDRCENPDHVKRMLGFDEGFNTILSEEIFSIMKRNDRMEYKDIDDARKMIDEFEDIVVNQGYSEVFLMRGSINYYKDFISKELSKGDDEDLYPCVQIVEN